MDFNESLKISKFIFKIYVINKDIIIKSNNIFITIKNWPNKLSSKSVNNILGQTIIINKYLQNISEEQTIENEQLLLLIISK